MPGWHARTKRLVEEGRLKIVGIVVEQHPDRARLFMQWHEMDWPILWDPLNALELKAVPHTILIDEAGTVVHARPRPGDLEAFLAMAPRSGKPAPARSPDLAALADAAKEDTAAAGRLADALVLWGDVAELDRAIERYRDGLAVPDLAPLRHFRLGVALRRRYDSPARRPGDFAAAVEHWSRALALDPNQYIWRRRIQQYGPTLDKPYPFFNWVERARRVIRERGETPVPLAVEPDGAELAGPSQRLRPPSPETNPDPQRQIAVDARQNVLVEATVVPGTASRRRQAWSVHLEFRPNPARRSHWNNESNPFVVWIDAADAYQVDRHLLRAAPAATPVSDEPRRVQFQVHRTAAGGAGIEVTGFAVYGVCTDSDGTCRYVRRELRIPLADAQSDGETP